MMLCLENLLKSNTCITAVELSREDLDIWEQIIQINKKKKKHLLVLKRQFTVIGFLTAEATNDFVFDFREVVIMRYM